MNRRRSLLKTVCFYLALLALAVFMIEPLVWMALVSLQPSKSPIPTIDKLIPTHPQWSNYTEVLLNPTLPVSRFFFNSAFVTGSVVVGQTLVCAMAAYALSRKRFKGRDSAFRLFLAVMMFGGAVTQIPVFLMLKSLGWLDTYAALIVPGLSSGFTIFLLRQSFVSIPFELDEAAVVDGASDWTVFSRVILPMSKAALATAATFTFIGTWTDFFNPLIYTNSTSMRTLEVGLSIYNSAYGGSNWPLEMTASVIVMVPLLLVFLVGQRSFTRGVTLGAIK